MISFKDLSNKLSATNKKIWIWIGLGLAAVLAAHIYYVQEMLAALIALSVLFVGVSAAVLTIFLLVHMSKHIIAWATPVVGRVVRRGADGVEGVIASPVWAQALPHGLRRERLKVNERYKMVSLRFTGLRPNHVYKVGLRAGGAMLTIGLSAQKRISGRLGNWLREKTVTRI